MSLASAVVLLQTALSLLTLVNSNPSLPQSMRDNATAVAQQAISEAHAVLASKATSADVAEDDIASPADEAIAQAALAKTPNTQTVSLTPSSAKAGPAYVYPNPSQTPGAVLTAAASTICAPGYASSVRDVSTATKEQVYAEYGVSYPQPLGDYEVDHFIPLEIGGSNDIKNLWLEAATPTPGFHQKDQFEDFEHGQVCSGTISAAEVQRRTVADGTCTGKRKSRVLQRPHLRRYSPRHLCRRPPRRRTHHQPTTRPRITPRSTGILRPARAGRA